MRDRKQFAAITAVLLSVGMTTGLRAFAADNAYSVDMTAGNDEAWANVAMANDDTVTSGVNIRSSADADSEIVGYLYRGGAVTVLYKGEEWSEITSGDVTGYIRNEYLVYGTQAKGLAEYYGRYGVKASWNDINVFADQDAASEVVETANDGDTYMTIGTGDHWIEVQKGADSTAFISVEDVQPVILMNCAVSKDDADSNAAAQIYTGAAAVTASGLAAVSENVYDNETVEESYSEPAYTETSYEDTAYYDDTASYTETADAAYTDTSYTDTAYDTTYETSYSAPSTDGMDLAAKAQTLYQAYLEAQAAADAAVANGAGEQAIYDTAAAAQAAYAVYVAAQNAADEASWGTAAVSSDTQAEATVTETASQQTTEYTYSYAAETTDDTQYEEEDAESYDDSYTDESTVSEDTSTSTVSSSDLELLAALIYCEAGNQSYEGQVAVGAVVMNRVASSSFPNTIYDVIYASGQFTPAYSGALASALANGSGSNYIAAASAAMAGEDPTGGCLYFNTSHGSGVHIGAHWFY